MIVGKMDERFKIDVIIENGYPHYKICDLITGRTVHCDFHEKTETLNELMKEN